MPGHGLTSWALSMPVFFYIISRDLIEMLAMPRYSTDEQTEAQRGAALPKVYTAVSDRQGPKSGALVQGTAFLPQPCGVLGAAHICCSLLLGMPLPSPPTDLVTLRAVVCETSEGKRQYHLIQLCLTEEIMSTGLYTVGNLGE